LNEYLSFGKVVLSTNLQEIKIFNKKNDNLINIGLNTEDFIEKANILVDKLSEDTEESRIKRINVAKENSWNERFSKIDAAISGSLKLKSNNKNNWKKILIDKYKRSNYLFINRLSLFLVFNFLIFYTPLFWFMGEQLIIKDLPKKSDAIVVFSGDGEADYRNSSYQKRALDAVKLYNDGHANRIFLSSGRRQTIADVELIKLYLTSKGVPISSINMLNKYPDSTYQNVKMVKKSLDKNNVSSIIFLTAPHHSLRSLLLWKENAPEISLTIPDLRNFLSKDVRWGVELDEMKVILYEYAAILHNWIAGRL